MIHIGTPIVERPKTTHTPPSGHRNTPSASSKFLKDVTGKGLRKIGAKLSRTPSSNSSITLSPDVEYVEQFPPVNSKSSKELQRQFNLFKKRPTPLNLSTLTPPSSTKKEQVSVEGMTADIAKLESPIDLSFDMSRGYNAETGMTVQQSLLAFDSTLFDPSAGVKNEVRANSETFGLGLYDEVSSPTCVMQMRRNMRKASCTKRYNTSTCSICHEKIQTLLGGERIIELECGHQCHMDCFLAMMDKTTFKPPVCEICGKRSAPVDEQVYQDLIVRKVKQTNAIRSHSESTLFVPDLTLTDAVNSASISSEVHSAKKIVTPQTQLIKTAQISSNGFRDVFEMLEESFEASTPRHSVSVDPLCYEPIPRDQLRVSAFPKLKKYTVNRNSTKIILPHLLSMHIPKNDVEPLSGLGDVEDGLSRTQKSLQVILCVSIVNSDKEHNSDKEYLISIKEKIRQVLKSLESTETLGLVIVGKDGSGQVGCHGTFYGFVDKGWDGWEEIIQNLEVVSGSADVFPNPIWEAKQMLQTTERMMLTASDLRSDIQLRHMVVVTRTHDLNSRVTRLEDSIYERKISNSLDKIVNHYQCSVSQWIDEDELKPFVWQEYGPRWQYQMVTKLCEERGSMTDAITEDSFTHAISRHLSLLRASAVNSVSVTVSSLNNKLAKLHTMDFNGSLYHISDSHDSKTDGEIEIQVKLGPLQYGDHRSIIIDVEIDVETMIQHMSETSASTSISFLQYTSSQTGMQAVSSPATIELNQTRSSPALTHTTPVVFHLAEEQDLDHSKCFLDLPLVPPSSPACDSLFVTRQIELMVIGSLRNLIHVTSNSQNQTSQGNEPDTLTETTLKELTTVVFGMSRDCSSLNLQYYEETGHATMANYIELLTDKLEQILHRRNRRATMLRLVHQLQ